MIRALAITVSNRAAAGVYEDRSGPVLVELLRQAGCDVVDGPLVIPDGDAVEQVLRDSVTAGYDVAITTGGTGLTPTDQTPEMTRRVLDWEIPGIAEALRSAGVRLRPMQIAVAASAGRRLVSVRPRPRVVVLSTGDELTEPGTPLLPGQIWDSNSYMLAAAAREAGAVADRRSGVPDDPSGVLPVLESQLDAADLLITTGGVSMGGEHDVVKAALARLGTVTFRKVAMQPGMPQGFGTIGVGAKRVPIFTLPGNPVSAYVSFQLFVRPALAALQGAGDLALRSSRATLTGPVRSPGGRRSYLRGVLDDSGGSVTPLSGQGSHQIAALGRANALIVVPEADRQLPAGETVEVLVLP